eukprot:scaffold98169_cov30-Cyclotella_meneghiniana.AAC.1
MTLKRSEYCVGVQKLKNFRPRFTISKDETIWECIECYLNLPDSDTPEENPLSYAHIREQQQQDQKLLALLEKYPDNYYYDNLDDDVNDVICYKKRREDNDWKIALPDSMVPE